MVFFGGVIPKLRQQAAMQALENTEALVVVGSSLVVYSGFRPLAVCYLFWAELEIGVPYAAFSLRGSYADTSELGQSPGEMDSCIYRSWGFRRSRCGPVVVRHQQKWAVA